VRLRVRMPSSGRLRVVPRARARVRIHLRQIRQR
jgi:hypothetical protein